MDISEHIEPKCKRLRINPTKKWTLEEEKALIEFLMTNRDIEKPTAQVYYKRFSAEMKVDVEWKLTRAKVRNMHTSYNKTKCWEGSTGAGSMNGETVKATLLKMCTYFYELDDIFGRRLVENAIIEETIEIERIEPAMEENLTFTSSSNESENVASTIRKGIYSRTALSDILEIHSEMLNFRKEKAEKECTYKEKELALKEREIQLREMEIKSNERIKIMELEMKERLAMVELN